MTHPFASIDLEKLKDEARQHVCDLAAGRKKWNMCIPPEPGDSDMLLCTALDELWKEIERLREIEAMYEGLCK